MKPNIKHICFVFIFIVGISVHGAPYNWETLRISNHYKAPGIDFSIQYPQGWTVNEGKRPHMVKFLTNENRMLGIVASKAPMTLSTEEADNLFSAEDIKGMLPNNARVQACKKTKLEGQTAWIVFYFTQNERMGTRMTLMTVNCILVYRNYLLQLQSSLALPPSNDDSFQNPSIQNMYKQFVMESMEIFNSLVIYNRY